MKVSIPTMDEAPIGDVINTIQQMGDAMVVLRKHYPRAYNVMFQQMKLTQDTYDRKNIVPVSTGLYKKKLEVAIMEDEEKR